MVLFLAIGFETLGTFVVRPSLELSALPFLPHQRNSVTAGIRNTRYLDNDDGTRTRKNGKVFLQARKFCLLRLDQTPAPMHPKDIRWALKSAEHENNAPIFAKVRHSFNAAAGQVQISDGGGAQDAKRVQTLGGNVDMALRIERRSAHEEHVLRKDKLNVGLVKGSCSFGQWRSPIQMLLRNFAMVQRIK